MYLGSIIPTNCCLDDEMNNRIYKATSAFGRLKSKMFQNYNPKLKTKIVVYNAVVISALLYGSEAWTLYQRQVRIL